MFRGVNREVLFETDEVLEHEDVDNPSDRKSLRGPQKRVRSRIHDVQAASRKLEDREVIARGVAVLKRGEKAGEERAQS